MNEFASRHFTQLLAAWIILVGISIAAGFEVLPGLGTVLAFGVLIFLGVSLHRRPDDFGSGARLLFWSFVFLPLAMPLALAVPIIALYAAPIMAVLIFFYWLLFARIWYPRTQPLSKERGYVLFLTTQGLLISTLALAALIYSSVGA